LSYQPIIAQWLAEGKKIGFVRRAQTASVSVAADRELSIYKDTGEIIALPCHFLFDSDKMGVRLIIDGIDTEKYFTAERLYSLGLIEYNGFIWCSRYEPANDRYAISVATTPKSNERFELKIFNEDTTAHNIVNYTAAFAKVVYAPAMTLHELLAGIYEKLPIAIPPPEVKVPPPVVVAPPPKVPPPVPRLKKPRSIPTRKRGVVEG